MHHLAVASVATMQEQEQDHVGMRSVSRRKTSSAVSLNSQYLDSLRYVMRLRGSVLVSSLPVALLSALVAVFSSLIRKDLLPPIDPWWAAAIQHPLAVQVFGIMFAFLITNRVAAAINRWWDGMSTVSHMLLKWYDAEAFILSYLKKDMRLLVLQKSQDDLDEGQKQSIENRMQQLRELQQKLIHWFSLMNAVALSTLKHGEADCMNHISCKIHDFDWLSPEGFTSFQGPCKMSILKGQFYAGLGQSQVLSYIGVITSEEMRQFAEVEEKPALISQWITEALVLADSEGLLNIPPPLASRAHIRMADAMQGFNDAYRLAAVPYPFALAQMISILMHAFIFLMPIVIEKFTQAWILTPLLSFLITLSYWGLNSVAMELENPFGEDVNDLPLKELCESYIEKTMESCAASNYDVYNVHDSSGVHTYSKLYKNGGCLPNKTVIPSASSGASTKSNKPEEDKPATSACSPPDPSPEVDVGSLAVVVTPNKNFSKPSHSHTGGAYGKSHNKHFTARPLQHHCHPKRDHRPMYYQVRPAPHQWLVDRAASKKPDPVLQAARVKKEPKTRCDPQVSTAEVGRPEAAAGSRFPMDERQGSHSPSQRDREQRFHSPEQRDYMRVQVSQSGRKARFRSPPLRPRPRSHSPCYVRPYSAPYGQAGDAYIYETFDDLDEYHSMVTNRYLGAATYVPVLPGYEGQYQLHHPHAYHSLDYIPAHRDDEGTYQSNAEELC